MRKFEVDITDRRRFLQSVAVASSSLAGTAPNLLDAVRAIAELVVEPRSTEACVALEVIGARRPDEIVDVVLMVAVRGGSIDVVVVFTLDAGRAEDPSGRHRHPHVVRAVVGKKLRAAVKLMTVPAAVLQHAELGKPLCDQVVVADDAGSRECPRYVCGPRQLDP